MEGTDKMTPSTKRRIRSPGFKLRSLSPSNAYLRFPNHPLTTGQGRVASTATMNRRPNGSGPDITFDYDENGEIVGIEVLY